MNLFTKIMGGVLQYGALAVQAVAQVQMEAGPSNADPGIQQSKKQLAVAYVIAAAHAGEQIPVSQVQQIASVVDLVASTAKALGAFGKTPAPSATTVSVPPAVH